MMDSAPNPVYAAFPAYAGRARATKANGQEPVVWSIHFIRWVTGEAPLAQRRYLDAQGTWRTSWTDTKGVRRQADQGYSSLLDIWPELKRPLGSQVMQNQTFRTAIAGQHSFSDARTDFHLLFDTYQIHFTTDARGRKRNAQDPAKNKELFPAMSNGYVPFSAAANFIPASGGSNQWVCLLNGNTHKNTKFSSTAITKNFLTVRSLTSTWSTDAAFAGPGGTVLLLDRSKKLYTVCPLSSGISADTQLCSTGNNIAVPDNIIVP
ncbi:hypothetical protein [Streptomyces griseoviridis]|uniref:Uncharacterized protein n=1 Tax=Streptomyces griseoviridis TaxID=45398 RepID=A0ABT9LMR7_STRGD|nr:hypothetical protein [Streptomyces griseoviridis]MDP9684837.1 hypothetical protein [Streptomyces griseoviridis]